ncbi:MAG TPA: hypothetical protein V6C52_11100 [Coleofasciculaceae cyanobacterium]|jgi:hypothetical protein
MLSLMPGHQNPKLQFGIAKKILRSKPEPTVVQAAIDQFQAASHRRGKSNAKKPFRLLDFTPAELAAPDPISIDGLTRAQAMDAFLKHYQFVPGSNEDFERDYRTHAKNDRTKSLTIRYNPENGLLSVFKKGNKHGNTPFSQERNALYTILSILQIPQDAERPPRRNPKK